jgi:hypothetical protein
VGRRRSWMTVTKLWAGQRRDLSRAETRIPTAAYVNEGQAIKKMHAKREADPSSGISLFISVFWFSLFVRYDPLVEFAAVCAGWSPPMLVSN